MISLEQILLLQDRVENAVAKIAQLNAENVALRRKCAELTNALAAKTEQFSSFQNDQNKIEEGILKALNRLDALENTVLSASSSVIAQKNQENNSETVKSEENNSGTESHSDNSIETEEKISSENTAEAVPVSNENESQSQNSNEPELNLSEQNENQIPADVSSETADVEKSENPVVQNEAQSSENSENIVQTQNQENITETANPVETVSKVSENNAAQEINENVQASNIAAENLQNSGNPEKTQGDSSSQALFDIF